MNDALASGEPYDGQVDLTTCDREPIHILGRTQSYGVLIAVSSDWIIQHVSENIEPVLHETPENLIGTPLDAVMPRKAMSRIRAKVLEGRETIARLFGIKLLDPMTRYDVSIHKSGRHTIIECEPKQTQHVDSDTLSDVYPLIQRIRAAGDINQVVTEAARAVRLLTGFDSVMVYQFQGDASGSVVAENRRGDLPSYLGLRFPASDIPVQARQLYKRSLLRLIADVDDEGSALYPQVSPEGSPLDLSLSVTRAVSPIHLEYLRNMGVQASMSVSIMRNGELWGLFACHHHSPRYLEFERRTAVELFAHLFSYELTHLEEQERSRAQSEMSSLQTRLMALMAQGEDLAESLIKVSSDLREVIPHDGMVLFADGDFHQIGSTPTKEEFAGLARFLNTTAASGVFTSDSIGKQYKPAVDCVDRFAGLMAIPISRRPRDYLVLFRREIATSVTWAGNPQKPVTPGPNGLRLTPRKSFDAWREIVAGHCVPWNEHAKHSAELLRVLLLEIFLKITDATADERKRAQERQELLISELNHRVRNILNLMRGLVKQSSQERDTAEAFAQRLDGRIQSLARAHDQLTEDEWDYSSLKDLIHLELAAYTSGESSGRVELLGDDVQISPRAFTNLALVIHELVTNSVKYGCLSNERGRLIIALGKDSVGGLTIDWRERGGPAVTPPKRRGFGSSIIERFVPFELQGEADIQYKVSGVEARFVIPANHVEFVVVEETESVVAEESAGPVNLTGVALVLEDTMIIAMDAADIMTELGATDVRICSNVNDALKEIETHDLQIAILDVNLGSEQSLPVAEKLAEIGVPFVVATGYGDREDLKGLYPDCPFVRKPFSNETLEAAVAEAMDASKK